MINLNTLNLQVGSSCVLKDLHPDLTTQTAFTHLRASVYFKLAVKIIHRPHPALVPRLEKLKAKYGPDFEFVVTSSYWSDSIKYGISDAAPVDMNISEDLPLEDLKAYAKEYALGKFGENVFGPSGSARRR